MDGHTFITEDGECCGMMRLVEVNDNTEAVDVSDHLYEAEGKYVLATTINSDKAGIAALKKNRFKALAKFRNPGTGNMVTIWGRKGRT